MWPGELLAELKVNNNVVVLSEAGIVEANGIIESIDRQRWYIKITVSGNEYDISGYGGSKYVILTKDAYEKAHNESVLRKFSSVIDKKIAYANSYLGSDISSAVLNKLIEIDELLEPVMDKIDKSGVSYEFQQKMHGNEALSLEKIKLEKLADFYNTNKNRQRELAEN